MQSYSHQNLYVYFMHPTRRSGAPARAPLTPILHVQNLTKVYSDTRKTVATRALNGMSLDVYQGEFISIMGPSGSGKTTLLNILAGLDRPTSGEVWLQGENLAAIKASELALFRRRNLGFVFQDFNLLDTLTLAENVALPLSLDRTRGAEIEQRVHELMQLLGLADQMRRYPYEVSGGQQQRAAVARAIIHRPRLLLADEPTGNLDSASARSLLELFAQLNRERQSTILTGHARSPLGQLQPARGLHQGRACLHAASTP